MIAAATLATCAAHGESKPLPITAPAGMAFVAPNGRAYHLRSDCRYIRHHEGVAEVPLKWAQVKRRPCSVCAR